MPGPPQSDDLPLPDSDELKALVPGEVHQVLYRFLYENRAVGITMQELRELAKARVGVQEQLDRRRRSLNKKFRIDKRRDGKQTYYHLVAPADRAGADIDDGVSGPLRRRVLEPGICFGCGKSPREEGVKLVVDHKIPRHWAGPSEEWNLQPLCVQCNAEKKERLSVYDEHSDEITTAMAFPEPQRRIGELLKAFNGHPVPADLVQVVASGGEYRNDWERRFRDLRTLGWDVRVQKYKRGKKWMADYFVVESKPWPKGSIQKAIARAEAARKKKRRSERS